VTDSDPPPESPVLEGDLIDPVPAPPAVDAEIIDADVVDDEPLETVPEYVVVAEPSFEGDDPAPRPFDAAPRVTRRESTPPPPPERPAACPPLLWPAPVPDPAPPRSDVDPAPVQSRPPGQHRYRPAEDPPRPARPPAANRRPSLPRRSSLPRRPWLGLPFLVLLGLAGAFLAWVSAEPFWLSVGHGETGTATVVASAGGCRATFVGTTFSKSTVELFGASGCAVGASMPARMVSSSAGRAYAASRPGLILRWATGYALVVLCGLLIARVIGARSHRGWLRAAAVAASLAAPLTVAAALLAAAY
jgi:hypothetical protein